MYWKHLGLEEQPFNITPDPAYLFCSSRQKEAIHDLLYGVRPEWH